MDHSVTRRKACRLAISAAGATLAAVVLPACSNSHSGMSGKARLNVGVRSDIVGFSERNPNNGKYYGFEIDLANELANRLGYGGCSFISVTPETREEMLSSGKVDCLIACYSISNERKKLFDFSAAYYTDSVILVVENTSLIQSFSQLKGGTIGTVSGTNAAPQLAAKFLELGLSDGIPQQQDAKSGNIDYDTWHLSQYASYAELSAHWKPATSTPWRPMAQLPKPISMTSAPSCPILASTHSATPSQRRRALSFHPNLPPKYAQCSKTKQSIRSSRNGTKEVHPCPSD